MPGYCRRNENSLERKTFLRVRWWFIYHSVEDLACVEQEQELTIFVCAYIHELREDK